MIRITKMSGKYYAIELPEDADDAMGEIRDFAEQSIPVLIVDDIMDVSDFNIDPYEVQIVERD